MRTCNESFTDAKITSDHQAEYPHKGVFRISCYNRLAVEKNGIFEKWSNGWNGIVRY
jgi:hypothetical protein